MGSATVERGSGVVVREDSAMMEDLEMAEDLKMKD